jgi:predicted ATPase
MITRLKIDGFKNLVKVDIRFGPFTCIAGANAVGKSNLFDALKFISDLTEKTLLDAAKSVRSEGQKNADIRGLFHHTGDNPAKQMSFDIEMIIPKEGVDELGQTAKATVTTVRYSLVLALRKEEILGNDGLLEIIKEELVPIIQSDVKRSIGFDHKNNWKNSVVEGRSTQALFISTEREGPERIIKFHKDGGIRGRPISIKASLLPRTVLSTADASQHATALIVKKEMQSWQMLRLQPSALRQPDEFYTVASAELGVDGSHLPALLYRLKLENDKTLERPDIYQLLSNRLFELIGEVTTIDVDKDEKRELLTLMLTSKDGTKHPARALSDGTLRFLGLAVLELDPQPSRVICLEEPENGIHPDKINAVLKLLMDISMDTDYPFGKDNPLRQVIINTHSPAVVQQVPEDSLLMAELQEDMNDNGLRYKKAAFSPLEDTWRTKMPDFVGRTVSLGKLLSYLNPTDFSDPGAEDALANKTRNKPYKRRVIDREDVQKQLSLIFGE